ncbi:MAG: glycosyltransferase family 2 protein [Paraprevotella sp.]|nr:glycosyltransferase family 2 protein [Paraprevotella sp.]
MTFSVITPVYNRENCVSRCIDSVLSQRLTHENHCVHILVDDGSRDRTADICTSYAQKNATVKFIRLSEHRGVNAARNAAIKICEGSFIIMLDSDDYFVKDALDIVMATIRQNPLYKHYMFAPDDVNYNGGFFQGCVSKELHYVDFLNGDVNTGFIHCISADIMKLHLFDETVRIYESVFFLSFYKEAQKMLFTNKIVAIREHNRHDHVTFEAVRTSKALIKRRVKAYEIMLSRFGGDLKRYHCRKTLTSLYTYLFDNYLLLGQSAEIARLNAVYTRYYGIYIPSGAKIKMLRYLNAVRGGRLYWGCLRTFLFFKYRVFRHCIR